jgi:DNA-binding GntR family transcriptional regulator
VASSLDRARMDEAQREAEAADEARASTASFTALDAASLRSALEASSAWPAVWLWNDLQRVPLALAARHPGPAPAAPDYLARRQELWEALAAGDAARAERLLGADLARLDRGLASVLAAPAREAS